MVSRFPLGECPLFLLHIFFLLSPSIGIEVAVLGAPETCDPVYVYREFVLVFFCIPYRKQLLYHPQLRCEGRGFPNLRGNI